MSKKENSTGIQWPTHKAKAAARKKAKLQGRTVIQPKQSWQE